MRGDRWIACAALLAATTTAWGTENGGNSYALGVETNFSGIMPPEGFHMFGYYSHYESSRNRNNDGDPNQRLARYKIRSDTVSTRLSYVYPGLRFLGANVESRMAVAVPTIELTLGIARPAPLPPLDRGGSTTGITDPQIAPILLGWHSGNVHQTTGFETFFPIGTYNPARNVNAGRHYWQIAPIYAITAIDHNTQFDFKIRYGINGKNLNNDYRSGNELSAEFSAGYRFYPHVIVGVNGFVYRQLTDDRQNGVRINGDGNRGQTNAIGPYIGYSFTKHFTLLLKVQSEFAVKNRPMGTRIWLQTKVPF